MLVAAALVAALIGAGRSAHATAKQQQDFATCMDVELDDGKSDTQIAKECCEGQGGHLFGSYVEGHNAIIWECVFPNDTTEEEIQATPPKLVNHINVPLSVIAQPIQVTPPARTVNVRSPLAQFFRK